MDNRNCSECQIMSQWGGAAPSWGDACGIFGVYAPGQDVARLTFFGLYAVQHRGQESAGIAVGHDVGIHVHKDVGLVSQVFDEETISQLHGQIAMGHVRYSTTGSSGIENAQPMIGEHHSWPFALGHNGNLINTVALREELQQQGVEFDTTSDTEVIVKLIEQSSATRLEEAIAEAMHQMQGAYSLIVMAPDRIIAVRDSYGIRPLCIGRFNTSGWVLSSETCGLHVIDAKFIREVEPGEIVTLDDSGVNAWQVIEPERKACCIFEFIYFARPDSHIYGRNIYMSRVRMGNMLATQAPVEADLVIPVPQTGVPHAIGYAQVSKIPFGHGFIKNTYIHRTFIDPDQRLRELGVRMKLTPLKEAIAGKRIVVLRQAGAREVHLRINCPPIRYPCFYGIDTSTREELIAARMTVGEICQHLGADSLEYLNMPNLVKAVGLPKVNFCTACFDGTYPIPIPRDVLVTKSALETEPVVDPEPTGG